MLWRILSNVMWKSICSRIYEFPLGTQVGLDPSHIVLDGDPSPPKGAQKPPPYFCADVYCGQTVAHLSLIC